VSIFCRYIRAKKTAGTKRLKEFEVVNKMMFFPIVVGLNN